MWSIKRNLEGPAAKPKSSHFGEDVNAERFAEWEAVNSATGVRIPLYVYLPKDIQTCQGLVFSIHGKLCNANKYRNIFVNSMQNRNVILIAPKFDTDVDGQRKSWFLNMGNMYSGFWAWRRNQPNPTEEWTFNIINEIYHAVKREVSTLDYYSVFGHSAGSQFAHRMAIFADQEELFTVVAANPGWFTVIDPAVNFPYGVKGLFSKNQLRKILQKRIVVLSGARDAVDDGNVRKTRRAMRQGRNRHERAKHFYRAGLKLAKKLNVDINWQLVVSPDLNHSAKLAAPLAADHLVRN